MDIGSININITAATTCRDHLKDKFLKELLSNYCNSLDLILTTLSVPISFMAHGLRKSKAFHFSLQDANTMVMSGEGIKEKDPKKTAEELIKYFEDLLKDNDKNQIENAVNEIEKLIEQVPILRESYNNLGLNALVNSWTIFEAFAKDLWIYCLNNYPKKYLFNLLKNGKDTEQEIDGISGKNITIGLLAKYDFDISKNLGDLLSPKYDFTSVRGIKKSFKDLFALKDNEISFFDNPHLSQLEITRHLLVHNSGIIDADYLNRTNRMNEILKNKISLTIDETSDFINAGIETLKEIFLLADNKLTSANSRLA